MIILYFDYLPNINLPSINCFRCRAASEAKVVIFEFRTKLYFRFESVVASIDTEVFVMNDRLPFEVFLYFALFAGIDSDKGGSDQPVSRRGMPHFDLWQAVGACHKSAWHWTYVFEFGLGGDPPTPRLGGRVRHTTAAAAAAAGLGKVRGQWRGLGGVAACVVY